MSTFAEQLKARRRAPPPLEPGGDVPAGPARAALAGRRRGLLVVEAPEEADCRRRAQLVHVTGAGVDRVAVADLPPRPVANTFHHARPIAEHVVMVALVRSGNVAPADRELRGGSGGPS